MKKLIKFGVVLFIGMAFLMGADPAMAKNIELKFAHFMPTTHVQHIKVFVPFAKKVAKLSNGKVTIKIYPTGQLGNPKTMVDSIRMGITDIGFVLPSYVPGRFKRSSVFELPFVFNSATHVTKVFYDIYDKYLSEDYKDFKVLWVLSAPLSQVHSVSRPLVSIADFKGRKIRSGNSMESKAIKLLGGNPVGMPISELSISLQKGVVDGCFTPYAALKSYKLIDVSKYITEFNFSGALMCVLMNKKKWDSLPASAKKVIDQVATREFGLMAAGAFDQEDLENKEDAHQRGIKSYKLSDAERSKIKEKFSVFYSEWVGKNQSKIPAQKILDAMLESAKKNQ
ncbi:MAG: TRAP transporter substrate-binding protein [Deltaproteobacteria bacterium]|nr:TRAP transporter substrate-binding protein [Deltaproteobacteria bacterium]